MNAESNYELTNAYAALQLELPDFNIEIRNYPDDVWNGTIPDDAILDFTDNEIQNYQAWIPMKFIREWQERVQIQSDEWYAQMANDNPTGYVAGQAPWENEPAWVRKA